MSKLLARFLRDDSGTTAIEYALISRRHFDCNCRGGTATRRPYEWCIAHSRIVSATRLRGSLRERSNERCRRFLFEFSTRPCRTCSA